MLIIEIALGIVLSVLILRYWPEILGISFLLVLAAARFVLLVGIILFSVGYPTFGLFLLAVAIFSVCRKYWERFMDRKAEAVVQGKRRELGYETDDPKE